MNLKNNKTKILSIIALVVAIIGMSLGFAAFSTALTISSSANVTPDSSTFSVKFSTERDSLNESNVSPNYDQDSDITASSGVIDNSGNPTLRELKANFTKPGQTVTYRFYVRNEGEYTAYLNNVNFLGKKVCRGMVGTTDSLVDAACNSISISATIGGNTYTSTTGVSNHSLASNAGEEVVVTLEYASNGAYVDGDFSVTFPEVTLVYSTIDDSTMSADIVRLESGSIDEVGSVVSIGNEQFYVIGKNPDNDSVKLLAMYNLHVGNRVDEGIGVSSLSNPTGIQDSRAKGMVLRKYPYIGVTAFSNVSSSYSGSIVEGYVNDYKSYLVGLGAKILSARLITNVELEALGCSIDEISCSDAPEWVYATSYWSETAFDASEVWGVLSLSSIGCDSYSGGFNYFGVRPVIEVSESVFEN